MSTDAPDRDEDDDLPADPIPKDAEDLKPADPASIPQDNVDLPDGEGDE